jgi:hypothetical protein
VRRIVIRSGRVVADAQLADTPSAQAVWSALPIETVAQTWGDEIYFEIPVALSNEPDARAEVEVGDLGCWPPESAFCILSGPTPASRGRKPRAATR